LKRKKRCVQQLRGLDGSASSPKKPRTERGKRKLTEGRKERETIFKTAGQQERKTSAEKVTGIKEKALGKRSLQVKTEEKRF